MKWGHFWRNYSNDTLHHFHGHDHLFVKQELDGIIYQTVPQPGAVHSDAARMAQEYGYYTGKVADGSGHLRLTVAPAQVTVDFIRASLAANKLAEVGFTYTISQ